MDDNQQPQQPSPAQQLPPLDMSTSQPIGGGGSQAGTLPPLDMSTSQPVDGGYKPHDPNYDASKHGFLYNAVHQNSEDFTHINPNDGTGTKLLKTIGGVLDGGGQEAQDTIAGLMTLVNKVVPDRHQTLNDLVTGTKPQVIPQSLIDRLHRDSGDGQAHDMAHMIGYGGETLAEFMLGDEALKGLSQSDKLATVAKWMKIAEKSPRLMQALKFGATAAKTSSELSPEETAIIRQYPKLAKFVGWGMDAARAGTVQGGQTLVRTGGDVGAAASDAVSMAGTSGLLGAATGTAGQVVKKLGAAAGKTKSLAALAEGAASKSEVATALGQRIDAAKEALHQNYEAGINDLQDRLGDSEVSAQDNPLADKAKELLANPDPAEHPFVAQAKTVAGDRLDGSVKRLISSLSTGEVGAKVAEAENTASRVLDAQGQPFQTVSATPQANMAPPYKIGDLIQLRQTVRKLADDYDYGDINSRALRQLLPSVDDTIGKLAEDSGDSTAVSDYQALRGNYRDKIGLFDDPVIRKIQAGKVDDAARDFVGTLRQGSALPSSGKVGYNTDILRGVIGDDGVKTFGQNVLGTILKDSTTAGKFNPEKFVST